MPPCLTGLTVKVSFLICPQVTFDFKNTSVKVGTVWNVWKSKFITVFSTFRVFFSRLWRKFTVWFNFDGVIQLTISVTLRRGWSVIGQTGVGRMRSRWEGAALWLVDLSIFLLDDEWTDIVPGFFIVFGVGPVTVRELQGKQNKRKTRVSYQVHTLCALQYNYDTSWVLSSA